MHPARCGELRTLSLDDLLAELRHRNWTLLRWGPPESPDLLAATFRWESSVDVLILRSETDASGYRTTSPSPLAPVTVTYQYHSSALWTLRALLSIPPPPHHRPHPEPPHPACALPADLPTPFTIRPL